MCIPPTGTQIIYVPTHANNDLTHSDCELGFVVAPCRDLRYVFCRYFAQGHDYLRTLANSEATPIECIVVKDHHTQDVIDNLLLELGYTPQEDTDD